MILPPRILFIGAHCDDIELLSGGLLAHACFSQRKVGVLVFSDHSGVIPQNAADQAHAEFLENISWLAHESGNRIENHSGTMMPACQGDFQKRRGEIYSRMESLRGSYDLVVTHPLEDTNQDHQQVAAEAARVFKAHAGLIAGEFPNNDLGGTSPQLWVTLSAREVDAKVRMIANYRSQDFGGRPYIDADVVRALLRLRGSQVRAEAAEAFSVLGRLVLRSAGTS